MSSTPKPPCFGDNSCHRQSMSPTEIALPFAPQLYAEALVGGQQIREADDAKVPAPVQAVEPSVAIYRGDLGMPS